MTSLLAHHPHQPIESTETDFILAGSTQPYQDFSLFSDSLENDQILPSTYLPQPLDLSVLGAIRDFGPYDSRQSTPYDRPFSAASDLGSMHGALSPDPRVRVQQTSFNTARSPQTPPPMHGGGNWAAQDQNYLSPTASTPIFNPHLQQGHKRLSSESSIASTGPDSPFSQSSAYPQIVDPETQTSPYIDFADPSVQFASTQFDKAAAAYGSHHHQQQQQRSPLQSVSFVNPAFQNLNLSGDDGPRLTGEPAAANMAGIPKLDRTMSDVYQDALYDASAFSASAPNRGHGQSSQQVGAQGFPQQYYASQHRTMFGDRLQQADSARSLTPLTDNSSRDLSPFTDISDLAGQNYGAMARPTSGNSRFTPATSTASGIRARQKMQEDALVRAQHVNRINHNLEATSSTISPKEALLDPPGSAKFPGQPLTVENNHRDAAGSDAKAKVKARNKNNHHLNTTTTNKFGSHQPQQQQRAPMPLQAAPAPAYAALPPFANVRATARGGPAHGGASVNSMTDTNSQHTNPTTTTAAYNNSTTTTSSSLTTDLSARTPTPTTTRTHHNEYSASQLSPSFSSSQSSTASASIPAFGLPNNPYNGYMASQNAAAPGGTPNYPFMNSNRRQSSSLRSEQSDIPPFPASLNSMESTKSESSREPNVRPPAFRTSETASPARSELSSPRQRPSDTSANAGSYTCTTPHCNARFDTAAKLHRHRKDSHLSPHTSASPQASNSSGARTPNPQAAINNLSRNNAPGPHRCDKINPSTGRACGTVFSRSYDLTRHEETIHSGNKKKVRCPHCTEEKLFSRNDALTRHLRVVHPEVEFSATKPSRGHR